MFHRCFWCGVLCFISLAAFQGCINYAIPNKSGSWRGQVVSITLYDGEGVPVSEKAAAIQILDQAQSDSKRTISDLFPSQIIVLTKDGQHALPATELQEGSVISVTGTACHNSRLKAPNGDVWADEISASKAPDASGHGRAAGVIFIHLNKIHVITPK